MTRERDVEAYFVRLIERAGGKAYKFVSPGCDGVPDRLAILPGGTIFFAELKAPGQKPRILQEKRGEEIAELGVPAFWIDSKEDAESLVAAAASGKLEARWGRWRNGKNENKEMPE